MKYVGSDCVFTSENARISWVQASLEQSQKYKK
jgi:hypothetical protein